MAIVGLSGIALVDMSTQSIELPILDAINDDALAGRVTLGYASDIALELVFPSGRVEFLGYFNYSTEARLLNSAVTGYVVRTPAYEWVFNVHGPRVLFQNVEVELRLDAAFFSGSDEITGGRGNDTLLGYTGNDSLSGGDMGDDELRGDRGNDAYGVNSVLDRVVELPGFGTDRVYSSVTYTLPDNVETLELSGYAAVDGTGNALANKVTGNLGNNVLDGRGSRDTLAGSYGDDIYVVDMLPGLQDVVTELPGAFGTMEFGGFDTLRLRAEGLVLAGPYTVRQVANVEILDLSATGTLNLHGVGTAGSDTMIGNAAANTLDGVAGNDTYVGSTGDDVYAVAQAGDGVSGEDLGSDTVRVTVRGHALLDLSSTPTVENVVYTNAAGALITGNDAANSLIGGGGSDTLVGGEGDDVYAVNKLADVVNELGVDDNDTVVVSIAGIGLPINVENLVLAGTVATGTGNSFANALTGNASANTLNGEGGADTLSGNAGNDVFVVDDLGDEVVESIAGAPGGVDLVRTSVDFTLGLNVEHALLLPGAGDMLVGNGLANSLSGGANADTLDGGTGNDSLAGGAGNDAYIVDSAADVATELSGAGVDTVRSSASYTLAAHLENLILTGSANANGKGNAAPNRIEGNTAANVINGAGGDDSYVESAGDDTYVIAQAGDSIDPSEGAGADTVRVALAGNTYLDLSDKAWLEHVVYTGSSPALITGNATTNSLTGSSGADTLNGAGGADTLAGGGGHDRYAVDDAGDVIVDSSGTDIAVALVDYSLLQATGVENLVLGGEAAMAGSGNALANQINGNGAANTLDGGTGADRLIGGAGDDLYIVDMTSDVITESVGGGIDNVRSSATYVLPAEVENLQLLGSAHSRATGNALANAITGSTGNNLISGLGGDDSLQGGAGNDSLAGGAGSDTLEGGGGADSLAGGAGDDRFAYLVFDATGGTIADFTPGSDRMVLDDDAFTALAAGPLTPGQLALVSSSTVNVGAAVRLVYQTDTGNLFYDLDGLDTSGRILLAKLGKAPSLTVADFEIVA